MVNGETEPSPKERADSNALNHKEQNKQTNGNLMAPAKSMEKNGSLNTNADLPTNSSPENGTEIKEETPVPEVPKKRGRGRPRKGEMPKKPVDPNPRRSERRQELDKKREEEERLERERRLHELEEERRLEELELEEQREAERKKRADLEEQNALLIAQGLEPIPIPGIRRPVPKKRVLPRKLKTRKRVYSNTVGPDGVKRRSKPGRPSKQDQVLDKVFSIFQQDGTEIVSDRSSATPEARISDAKDPGSKMQISLNFENKGQSTFSKTPAISGIRRAPAKPSEPESSKETKFVPFPVPELDDEGNLKDPEFIKTHLSEVASAFDPNSRLTDERAFFLEGSEGYFEQHSLKVRPSNNSLAAMAPSLDYEDFIPMVAMGNLIHREEKDALREVQKGLFHQFCFELSQGFNINFYGVGSKRTFVNEFIDDFFIDWYVRTIQEDGDEPPSVMFVNGFNPNTRLRSVLHDVVSLIVTDEDKAKPNFRMPKQLAEIFPFLISYLKKNATHSAKHNVPKPMLVLVIHNLDGEPFRDERSQNFLSQLASLPNVWLVSSTDHINVGLLWDMNKFTKFNFLWHRITTYENYAVESTFKDVLATGKSKKFVGTKGVKFVLASLTTNSKNLYKTLLKMQIDQLKQMSSSGALSGVRGNAKLGIERKSLYDECVREFIASNEISFNTMLGEYVEHKMCSLAKNEAGIEIAFVPFTYDEMQKILDEEF